LCHISVQHRVYCVLIAGNGVAFSTLNFDGSVIRVDPLSLIGSNAVTSATNLTHVEAIALAIPNGFGQVFFVDIWPLGLIMLLSCGLHSPMLMVYASLGSLSGALFAWAFDANITAIATGLWGFNPVLLAMLVGLTWTNGSQQRWVECNVEKVVVAVFLSLLTVLFTSLERFLFTSKLGVSAFTMPFCTVGVLYITVLTSPIVAPHIISA
jgi:urea transporter